jgi:hypothetical protein
MALHARFGCGALRNPMFATQRQAAASSHLIFRDHASCFPHLSCSASWNHTNTSTRSQIACSHVQSQFALLPDRRYLSLQCSVTLLAAFFFRHVQNNVDHSPDALLSNRTCSLKCRLLAWCSTMGCLTPPHPHLCFSPFTVPIRRSRAYLDISKPR